MHLNIENRKDYLYDFFVSEKGMDIIYIETIGEYGIFKLYEYEYRKKLAEVRGVFKLPLFFYNRITIFQDNKPVIIDRPSFSSKSTIEWKCEIYEINHKDNDLFICRKDQEVAYFKNNKKWYGKDSFTADISDEENLVFYISIFFSFYAF